jgi:hypothetical protein
MAKKVLQPLASADSDNNSESPKRTLEKPNPLVHLLAGFSAEVVCCIVYVPIDVLKERMQVQSLAKGRIFFNF